MNICIDQGNSRTKVALFGDDKRIVKTFIYKSFTSSDVQRLFSLYPLSDSIVSSVVNIEPSVVNALQRLSRHFLLFDHLTPVPIHNDYESPETLGLDRLAAAVGAATICPGKDLLIIDAGSAITYDVVTADGHYIGGNIAPGLKMRLYVLHQRTKKLPLVETDVHTMLPLFGKNTQEAIAAGVVRGIAYEVKGYIRTLTEKGSQPVVFITGGNAPFILAQVQHPMRYERQLVLHGLNTILEYSMQPADKQP